MDRTQDMVSRKALLSAMVALLLLGAPVTVNAQCSTSAENTGAPDREYMGRRADGQDVWVGQEFMTDCDGQFLTVSFLIDVQLVPSDGITNLTAGDVLTCSLTDEKNNVIASVSQVLTRAFGLEWVAFDFGFEGLGLAAQILTAQVSTPQEAYCLVGKSPDVVPGRMMQGNASVVNYVDARDMAFRATWDPDSGITASEQKGWGSVKALFR